MEENDVPQSSYQPLQDPEVASLPTKDADKFLTVIKYANMGAGIFISFVGLWIILSFQIYSKDHALLSFYTFFLPFFYVVAGLMLVLAEFYKKIADTYFLFLRSFLGRGLFNIFLATQTGQAKGELGLILGWALLVLGCIYIFLHFINEYLNPGVRQQLLD